MDKDIITAFKIIDARLTAIETILLPLIEKEAREWKLMQVIGNKFKSEDEIKEMGRIGDELFFQDEKNK